MRVSTVRNAWPSVELGQLIRSAQSGFASGDRAAAGTVQLRMNNVTTDGILDWSSYIRVPATDKQVQTYSLQPGDVLFNSTNSPELVGKTVVFPGFKEPVVFSNHFLRLRVDDERLDSRYLAHWITVQWQKRVFARLATQWVNQASVRREDLLGLQIPLPALPEQQRIAGILSRADRLRRLRRYALEMSESYLQSVFLEMFGDLVGNPCDRQIRTLGEIADIASGVTKGQKFNGRQTTRVPYLRVANVQDGYLDLSEIKFIEALLTDVKNLRLKRGDILMTEGGDYDKLGRGAIWENQIAECIHQNHIFRVRLDHSMVLPGYFVQLLLTRHSKSYFLQASKQTTNLATINMTQLKAFPVPTPPLELQRKFVEVGDQFNRLHDQQREALRQAEHLFQTLLYGAFRWEV